MPTYILSFYSVVNVNVNCEQKWSDVTSFWSTYQRNNLAMQSMKTSHNAILVKTA